MKIIYAPTIAEHLDEELDLALEEGAGVLRVEMSIEEFARFISERTVPVENIIYHSTLFTDANPLPVSGSYTTYRGVRVQTSKNYPTTHSAEVAE